jgi:hypothetical protein
MLGGPQSYGTRDVPSSSFIALFAVLGGVVLAPQALDSVFRWWLNRSPELTTLSKLEQDQEAS